MAQLAPSTLYLAQAAKMIEVLRRQFGITQFKTNDEIVEVFNKAMTKFEDNVGKSLTIYEPVVRSQVPTSGHSNNFWNSITNDLNILQDQLDLLKAAAVDLHNYFKTEILKGQEDNLVSQNKLKTLELYSNISDQSLIYFGDNFMTEELIDWNKQSSTDNRLAIIGSKAVGLGVQTQENALKKSTATVTVLEPSNGFIGNNQEIVDPTVNTNTAAAVADQVYIFRSNSYQPDKLEDILDGEPTTWVEFEKYFVNATDRTSALNLNFDYKFVDNNSKHAYLKPLMQTNGNLTWADGPSGDYLRFEFEIDLKTSQNANLIKLLPYGMQDNINNPIYIKTVTTSLDKTVWYTLFPKNVYLANGIDRRLFDVDAYHIFVGEGSWTAAGNAIRYIRFEIIQESPIPCKIGHHYYVSKTATDTTAANARKLGPIPPVDDTDKYRNGTNLGDTTIIQKMEYFTGKRYAIGIRDITVLNNKYFEKGTFVSKKFEVSGIIDRVALEADVEIPSEYDQTVNWIKFYLSPNDGGSWYPISRIQDDFLGIPEIVAFNDPTPIALREAGVGYYDIDGTVTSLRLKVEISRPANLDHSTPLLKPYKLKIKKRV